VVTLYHYRIVRFCNYLIVPCGYHRCSPDKSVQSKNTSNRDSILSRAGASGGA
jgi:hypothetical protein